MTSSKKKVILKYSFALKNRQITEYNSIANVACKVDLNLAPNLQSRNCDETSTKITRQKNLRYIKPNVSHRNPIFVAHIATNYKTDVVQGQFNHVKDLISD